MRRVVYVTDLEGRWEKLESALATRPGAWLDGGGRLQVEDGAVFVFGGDAVDRGPAGRRVVAALLDAWRRQPDRVVLLAGNRDLNKLRLARELRGRPLASTPPELRAGPRGPLLRWILARTMGAAEAFEHRAAELAGAGGPADDEAVVASYLDELAPDGLHVELLAASRLAHVEGGTLFVHGAVTDASLGHVPGRGRADDPRAWVEGLNAFCREQVDAYRCDPDRAGPEPRAWQPLVDYQAPLPGTRANQASVVYGRPTDAGGNPLLPSPAVVRRLRAAGIDRVVVGHTPSGDCPAVARADDGFELVLADNSYGRVERDALVVVEPDGALRVRGSTVLDDGAARRVDYGLSPGASSPVGRRDADGRLVKARLEGGDYLLFRSRGPGQVEQVAAAGADLAGRPLAAPWPE